MDPVVQKYLNAEFKYEFTQGPDNAHTFELAVVDGINCISLAHFMLKELFGVTLPTNFKSLELYKDTEYFDDVSDVESMKLGDLVWFGLSDPPIKLDEFEPDYKDGELLNWHDFPVRHVGIYTGDKTSDFEILHATPVDNTVTVWPLQKFQDYEKYKQIYGVRRLKP